MRGASANCAAMIFVSRSIVKDLSEENWMVGLFRSMDHEHPFHLHPIASNRFQVADRQDFCHEQPRQVVEWRDLLEEKKHVLL